MSNVSMVQPTVRLWNAGSAAGWKQRRDEARAASGFPAISDLRGKKLDDALATERRKMNKRLRAYYSSTVAWPVQKAPLETYSAPFSGTLYLPLNYSQKHGYEKIQIHEGDDLNFQTFEFYNQRVGSDYAGVNYVSTDGLLSRRNEYLGPAPYVSGYHFSANERKIMIEWWDIYLHEQWIGNERWEISLYFDTTIQGWVTRPRGDPDNSLDMKEYLGC
ncbi:uncharacterized protein STEHIDRAFT_141741 [Stereum hirsutum FP-91666 SS1]|uniref:uncharacterized protein n=1 Tax=Stereum hirsutum (strain FP-91666) TaxID=721885 RepID=UPI00044493F4|nr:uncharacterized protein STEHIDRAFT_141741 [Stereum hirsutum FP-91666 SS1]EIM82459.1 hypothetical protein STEHIDRAFT_141741 [Stereum hirsutum FP-91666 SS1]